MMMGQAPRNRRQAIGKTMVAAIWLLYAAGPVWDLFVNHTTTVERLWGALGLASFVTTYLLLISRHMRGVLGERLKQPGLAVLTVLCVALSLTLGPPWLVLFIFTSVAAAMVMPWRLSRWLVPLTTLVLVGVGACLPEAWPYYLLAYGLPCLGSGYTMIGVQYLIHTTKELRAAREEVARLAANEERLRLARDLHDLLGHSLSLITLKSELAGRMLPQRPEEAARQVRDIERVSRQALVDVREAVTGYRRPRLAVELAGARAALRTAGVNAAVDPALEAGHRGLAREEEGALAWALREAVTNVVRHSGAGRCEILLTEEWEADERRYLCLAVLDDGDGPPRGKPHEGNGLSGLRERLALADGRLETGPAPRGRGFALRAYVPLSASPVAASPEAATPAVPAPGPPGPAATESPETGPAG
ncbi:sensor histidine kinase [Streptomyces sp. MST-110588]|nr:sensor histidine kinase [Streptomyces sp. MST-110588]UNO43852.1 sensor histidine kinase [Streptomyces sp. MST-110588]